MLAFADLLMCNTVHGHVSHMIERLYLLEFKIFYHFSFHFVKKEVSWLIGFSDYLMPPALRALLTDYRAWEFLACPFYIIAEITQQVSHFVLKLIFNTVLYICIINVFMLPEILEVWKDGKHDHVSPE